MESIVSFSKYLILLIMLIVFGNCYTNFGSDAQLIPDDEVQTLKIISSKLKNNYWNVSRTSCSDGGRSLNKNFTDINFSNVTCNCSFNSSTVCHVTSIQLKGLNLSGTLPTEFGNLPHLQVIDLNQNYINGSIPTSFAMIPLVYLSLIDNRISGSIPKELGQISTLEELLLEDNQLGEILPDSLGNLSLLRRMVLSSNNFTGSIPETFGNLKNLTEFRIDGSILSGKIPAFIGNWSKIVTVHMQGTNMEGPIPSTISLLTNLISLRISDLHGTSMAFPNLQNLKQLQVLVLRNCLLIGTIPEYIDDMTSMWILDLSFNRLTGNIPDTIGNLQSLEYMNLVSSFPLTKSNANSWCLMKDLPCPTKAEYSSLFINCGGKEMSYDGNEYEEDLSPFGPSFFASYDSTKWAYSSTGAFLQASNADYIASNKFNLNITGPEYYETARLAPLSLRYYGLCLRKGSYRVQLHFAEIMYSNDLASIGRRIFDVYIQGNLMLKDFNIIEEAGHVGKGITKDFTNILVNSSTLEISLYWAGKGTTHVPKRGVYGPLISAITITPNFNTHTGYSVGAIVGIVIASCAILASLLLFLHMKGDLGRKSKGDEAFQGLDTSYFSLRQIKAATDDFSPINKIGEGGFGPVYKGVLADGKTIAIKQLSSKSKQGNREFVNEIGMISALQHPNLVKLHGCCIEGKELLLVYEYMENNSLARALFGRELSWLNLDWPTRKRICLGIARGLAYLHEESRLKIVHRDIKATNILLDKDLNAKISDFGLAKLDEDENTHISTRIAGTVGYMAPEYAMRGYLTDKADVYSFGVVILEIVSGKSNTNYKPKGEFVYLLDWAYVLQEQGNLLELVDPSLGSNFPKDEALRLLNLALLCANPSPTLRPIMSSVVSMIEGQIQVQAPIINQIGMQEDNIQFRAFERLSQKSKSIESTTSKHSQVQTSISVDGSLMNLSMSNHSKNEEVQDGSPSSKMLSEIELFDVNLD